MRHPNFFALVEDYLAMRRNLGFDVERMRWLLRDFARFIGRIEHRGPITVDLATRWALSSRSPDPARAERRLWAVRQFARHLAAFDPATEIPPAGLFGRVARRNQPHIYSDAEITALLQECSRLQPRDGLRPRTYVALFSLLASTRPAALRSVSPPPPRRGSLQGPAHCPRGQVPQVATCPAPPNHRSGPHSLRGPTRCLPRRSAIGVLLPHGSCPRP